jgi:hypothetical protein
VKTNQFLLTIFSLLLTTTAAQARQDLYKPTVEEFLKQEQQKQLDRYLDWPYENIISRDQLAEAISEISDGPEPTNVPYKKVTSMITIDRQDTQTCQQIVRDLYKQGFKTKQDASLKSICHQENMDERYVTIYVTTPYNETYRKEVRKHLERSFNQTWLGRTDLSPTQTQMRGTIVAGLGGIIALSFYPGAGASYSTDNLRHPWQSWKEHVKAGPVRDADPAYFNYVLHPYAGAAYYMQLRTTGASPLKSFGYSVMMSTIFWEYGWEAIQEIPSKQDLVNTPVLGSIFGEVFYRTYEKIQGNDGEFMGSKKLGKAMMFFLNPFGEMAKKLNNFFQRQIFKNATTFYGTGSTYNPSTGRVESYPAVYFRLEWY